VEVGGPFFNTKTKAPTGTQSEKLGCLGIARRSVFCDLGRGFRARVVDHKKSECFGSLASRRSAGKTGLHIPPSETGARPESFCHIPGKRFSAVEVVVEPRCGWSDSNGVRLVRNLLFLSQAALPERGQVHVRAMPDCDAHWRPERTDDA